MVIILMGVSGCGKSTIGELLSKNLNLPYYDADDFHPKSNVDKMSRGEALNDEDRTPWLELLSHKISEWDRSGGAILACSALKEKYRTQLSHNLKDDCHFTSGDRQNRVLFIYLKGTKELIQKRLSVRSGHYMPPELLNSQFKDLEEPSGAMTVNIEKKPSGILSEILSELTKFTENRTDHKSIRKYNE